MRQKSKATHQLVGCLSEGEARGYPWPVVPWLPHCMGTCELAKSDITHEVRHHTWSQAPHIRQRVAAGTPSPAQHVMDWPEGFGALTCCFVLHACMDSQRAKC